METVLLVGFALGLRHATDADHIVAISALLSDSPQGKPGTAAAARTGALWGCGHLLAVFLAGGLLVALPVQLPSVVEWSLELLVACILVWIGIHTIRRCVAGRVHFHFHQHGIWRHAHLHFHAAREPREDHNAHLGLAERKRSQSALLLGVAHGLAGTASLTLLVLASIPSQLTGVLYLLTFGLGALVGMMAFSTLFTWPLARISGTNRNAWLGRVRLLAGAANAAFGAFLVHRALLPGSFPF